MAGKRSASSDLNHDNWDDDVEPEEAGTFKAAPQSVLQTRVFKAARRRNAGAAGEDKKTPNVFSNFTGFAAAPSTSPANAFGFLAKATSPVSTPASSITQNGFTAASPTTNTTTSNTNGNGNKTEYYAKLKGLNESVSQWIKTHVDENPLCNLTPVFKDYEKYLKEIEDFVSWSTDAPETKDSTPKPTPNFSFGTQKTESEPKPDNKPETKPANPFVTSFGNTAAFGSSTAKPFSFGGDKPFAFANVAPPPGDSKEEEEESDEPPKVEFTKVVEGGSIHNVRCKVFAKKDKDFVERGVGQLYLKPIDGSDKTQLIVRADTNLGNLIMNVVLSKSIPTSRQGKNHVMIVCVPTPEAAAKAKKDESPLQTMLIKVKTADDADKLLEIIEKCKK